jgi:hypothetical protein
LSPPQIADDTGTREKKSNKLRPRVLPEVVVPLSSHTEAKMPG